MRITQLFTHQKAREIHPREKARHLAAGLCNHVLVKFFSRLLTGHGGE